MSVGPLRARACAILAGVDTRPTSSSVVVLLGPDHAQAPREKLAQEVTAALDRPVTVRRISGNTRDDIPAVRTSDRYVALLYVCADDDDALAAIESGADEVLVTVDLRGSDLRRAARLAIARADARLRSERLFGSAAHAEKLRSLGALVAGVAHEINNPCAALTLLIEVMRRRLAPLSELEGAAPGGPEYRARLDALLARAEVTRVMPEVNRVLDDMGRATETISSIVRDLHVFTRVDELEKPQRVDVHEIINQVLRLAGSRVTTRGHVERDFSAELPQVFVPRSRLAQVLTNVLVNAAQAIAEVERPVHRVQVSTRADDEGVIIAVRDTGPGIPPEHLERVFDPFFTTKKPGEGTGLGLALSSDLVRRMGGQLLVQSTYGEGATFMIYLPAAPDDAPFEPAAPLPSWRPAANAQRRRSVLVVDDDERVLRAYARVLRDDYDVLLATDGQEAIDLLRSGSRADVVLTDLEMPEVSGLALIEWLRAERPALARRVVMATATPLAEIEDSDIRGKVSALLGKPVSPSALLAACEQALSRAEPRR